MAHCESPATVLLIDWPRQHYFMRGLYCFYQAGVRWVHIEMKSLSGLEPQVPCSCLKTWKPRHAVLSGSQLEWYEAVSVAEPLSKPAGTLFLNGATVTTEVAGAKLPGQPSATITVVSADGKVSLQLGAASLEDSRSWDTALRAAAGDAAAQARFAAKGSNEPGLLAGSSSLTQEVAVDPLASAQREAETALRHAAATAEPPPPYADDTTAALHARIAELEAQQAAEEARRAERERSAAADAARSAQLLAEREAAQRREVEVQAELRRRAEEDAAAARRETDAKARLLAEQAAQIDARMSRVKMDEKAATSTVEVAAKTSGHPPVQELEPAPGTSTAAAAEASIVMIAASLPPPRSLSSPAARPAELLPLPVVVGPQPPAPALGVTTAPALASTTPVASHEIALAAAPAMRASEEGLKGIDTGPAAELLAAAAEPEWGEWSCSPDGEDRVAMRKRM